MRFTIALPNTIPGVDGRLMTRWAVRAEERGFGGLAATERVVYPSHDSLACLAAAAAVTDRIGLLSNILIGPLRGTAMLAKEAATLASLSGGRFSLGLAPGVREDDFAAAEREFVGRGERFDRQLRGLRRIWSGEEPGAGLPLPPPVSIPLLVGGVSPAAIRRAAQLADGWTAPGLSPSQTLPLVKRVHQAWSECGRPGRPHIVALLRFVLGDDVAAESEAFLRHYFAVVGATVDDFVKETPRTPAQIREKVGVLADGGVEEIVFHPTVAQLSQVDRLADVLL